jgi:aspartyl/glutamyl-tRNA(Asn/Gln) amidotransferase C subunit
MNILLKKTFGVVSRSYAAVRARHCFKINALHTSTKKAKEFTDFGKPQWSIKETFLTRNINSETITREDLIKAATLAGLAPTEDKIPALLSDLDNILQSVKTIQRVDTTGVTPLLSVLERVALKQRDDNVMNSEGSSASGEGKDGVPKVLELPSVRDGQFYVVPKQKADFEDDIE